MNPTLDAPRSVGGDSASPVGRTASVCLLVLLLVLQARYQLSIIQCRYFARSVNIQYSVPGRNLLFMSPPSHFFLHFFLLNSRSSLSLGFTPKTFSSSFSFKETLASANHQYP